MGSALDTPPTNPGADSSSLAASNALLKDSTTSPAGKGTGAGSSPEAAASSIAGSTGSCTTFDYGDNGSSSQDASICNWRPDPNSTSQLAKDWFAANAQQSSKGIGCGPYTVVFGDCLDSIAQRELKSENQSTDYNSVKQEVAKIVSLNQDHYQSLNCNSDYIKVGWKLKLTDDCSNDCALPATPPAEVPKPVEAAPPPPPPVEAAPPPPAPPVEAAPPPAPPPIVPPGESCGTCLGDGPAHVIPQSPVVVVKNPGGDTVVNGQDDGYGTQTYVYRNGQSSSQELHPAGQPGTVPLQDAPANLLPPGAAPVEPVAPLPNEQHAAGRPPEVNQPAPLLPPASPESVQAGPKSKVIIPVVTPKPDAQSSDNQTPQPKPSDDSGNPDTSQLNPGMPGASGQAGSGNSSDSSQPLTIAGATGADATGASGAAAAATPEANNHPAPAKPQAPAAVDSQTLSA